VKVTKFKATD